MFDKNLKKKKILSTFMESKTASKRVKPIRYIMRNAANGTHNARLHEKNLRQCTSRTPNYNVRFSSIMRKSLI